MLQSRSLRPLNPFALLALAWLLALGAGFGAFVERASAAPTELFFSEYVEGSSTNKALEIYNGTAGNVTLEGVYDVQIFANGSASATATIPLSGVVAAGDVFVLARAGSASELTAHADQTTSNFLFNGDDAVVLRRDGVVVDAIGQVGFDPGSAWASGDTTTLDVTLRRDETVTEGDADAADPFDPALQWTAAPIDSFGGLGSHTVVTEPTNRPPSASADSASAAEAPLRIDVLANDSDPDGDALTVIALNQPSAGSAEIVEEGAAVRFTPPSSSWQQVEFSYTVADPGGASDSAAVVVTFDGEPQPADPCEQPATIEGTPGRDIIFGTAGADVIHAGAGDDLVFGLGGDDIICGGEGRDLLFGNSGADVIVDDAGRSLVFGGRGDDEIIVGEGRDFVDGGPGLDVCTVQPADRVRRCP